MSNQHGLRCPKCGYEDGFSIECNVTAVVTVEGATVEGDIEWSDSDYCSCGGCGHDATVKEFTEGEDDEASDPTIWTAVENVKTGDEIDLEGDSYADPDNKEPAFKTEYMSVDDSEYVGSSQRLTFADHGKIYFPRGHMIKVLAKEA